MESMVYFVKTFHGKIFITFLYFVKYIYCVTTCHVSMEFAKTQLFGSGVTNVAPASIRSPARTK